VSGIRSADHPGDPAAQSAMACQQHLPSAAIGTTVTRNPRRRESQAANTGSSCGCTNAFLSSCCSSSTAACDCSANHSTIASRVSCTRSTSRSNCSSTVAVAAAFSRSRCSSVTTAGASSFFSAASSSEEHESLSPSCSSSSWVFPFSSASLTSAPQAPSRFWKRLCRS
jgi:hypothetical protein